MTTIPIAIPSFDDEELELVNESIRSGWITQGPFVQEFEKLFGQHHGVNYAVATSSCTTALHLMLANAGIKEGDEVIVPSFTWVATANAVRYCGATPVFADIDLNTFNINLEDTLRKVTPKTRAVIVVHLFGLCVDVEEFQKNLPNHVKVLEDAACAAGAKIRGKYAGSLGESAAFSFHPRKIITTGEGGMVTTNNPELANSIRVMRNHGAEISEEERHKGPAPYLLPDFRTLGFNYRMTDLQGAMGVAQTRKLEKFIFDRSEIAIKYQSLLTDVDWLTLPTAPDDYRHSWQSFVVILNTKHNKNIRNLCMEHLYKNGISTRPGTHAIHQLDLYQNNSSKKSNLKNSQIAAEMTISLPIHNQLTDKEIDYIVDCIKKVKI